MSVALGCGRRPLAVAEAAWKYWGPTSAMANAVVSANACDPDCTHGLDQTYAVVLVLDGVETPPGGVPQFSRATIVWAGDHRPRGVSTPLTITLPVVPG